MIKKLVCYLFYYLGDICFKLNDYDCYQYFMTKSSEISDKYNLGIWKEVTKPLDES
jgi:hypothetical protein